MDNLSAKIHFFKREKNPRRSVIAQHLCIHCLEMSSDYELLNEELTETTREAERALVRRLDRRLLAFAMMGNVIKVLDNTNLCEFNRNIINWTS